MELDKFRNVDLVINHVNDNFFFNQFVSQNDNDGRSLTVQITNDGVVGKVPGLTLNLRWANQTSGLADLSAFECIDENNSVFQIKYPRNMLNPGRVIASIQIIQNGQVSHSKQFEITVQQLAGQAKGIIEKAEYGALVEVLADSNKFRTDIDTLDNNKAEKSALSTTNTKVDYLASEKVDKGGAGQVTWGMIGQDARENISGGKVAVVGENSVGSDNVIDGSLLEKNLADKAVTSVKTDFLDGTKQYIDQALFKQGYYYASINGTTIEEKADTSLQAYPPIPVLAGKHYYLTNFRGVFCWYVDAKNTIIKRLDTEMDRLFNYSIYCSKSGFLLLSKRKGDSSFSQVFDTDEYNLLPENLEVFEPQYVAANLNGLIITSENVADKSISATKTDFIIQKAQLCDPEGFEPDMYWGRSGGYIGMTEGVGLCAFKKIPIKKGDVYSIFGGRLAFCWVSDIPGKFIDRFSTNDVVGDIEYEVKQDGFLYLTAKKNESSPRVFNSPLAELDIDTLKLKYGEKLNELTNPKLPNKSVKANQTTFAKSVFQMIDETESSTGYYWNRSGDSVTLERSDKTIAYNKIPVVEGETYSIINVRGVFGWAIDKDSKIIERFSLVDAVQTFEWIASVNGYICLSRYTYDRPSKVFDTALENIIFDPTEKEQGECAVQIPALLTSRNKDRVFTVAKDGTGQFSTVKEAIEAVKFSNKYSQITIEIHEGEYDLYSEFGGKAFIDEIESHPEKYDQQVGIRVPNGVNIIGVGNVVLRFMVPDSDAGVESAQRISVLNVALQHSSFENLTLEAQNTRYVVHDETNNVTHDITRLYRNVKMIHHGNRADLWPYCTAFGSGTGSNGRYLFENCKFASTTYGLGVHDNRDQKKNIVCLNNCEFEGGTVPYDVRFTTYGNGVEIHEVIMNNCKMSKGIETREEVSGSDAGNRWKISGGGNTKAPYKNINATGEKLRIEFADETARLENVGVDLQTGNVVKLSGIGKCTKIGTDENFLFYGVSLENTVQGERALIKYSGFLNRSDTPISSLAAGDRVGIVDGNLAKVSTGEYVGYAIDNENILLRI